MIPSHERITDYEELLAMEAGSLKGRNAGWGCEIQD
jgi:hypothetical protein